MKNGRPRRYLTPAQYLDLLTATAEHRGSDCYIRRVLAARCPLVGSRLLVCRPPFDPHHLLPQRCLNEHVPAGALLGALTDPRGCILTCRKHHDMVEAHTIALELDELPSDVFEFAAEHGLGWWLEKRDARRNTGRLVGLVPRTRSGAA